MGRLPFEAKLEALPAVLPIFPLPGALLLPRGTLPLNIFEPRYLAMVSDVLGAERMIGMIQPLDAQAPEPGAAPIYRTGCVGRITGFEETPDGRFLISLTGICRFDVAEEIEGRNGYRRVRASYEPYRRDLEEEAGRDVDRDRLIASLKPYLRQQGVQADFEAIGRTPTESLVNSLAMICPFQPHEKQALLEAPGLAARAAAVTALIEMAVHESGGGAPPDVRH